MNDLIQWLKDLKQYGPVMGDWVRRRTVGTHRVEDHRAYEVTKRRLLDSLHPRTMTLKLEDRFQESPSAWTLRFVRTDGPIPVFRGGQYINLFVELEGLRTSRPYSISSPPGEPHIDLTIRSQEGDFVPSYLTQQVEVGHSFQSSGPAGHFYNEPLIDGDRLVYLAGGSGITPFVSMLKELESKGFPKDVSLVYGSRDNGDIIFEGYLRDLARRQRRFRVHFVISEPGKGYRGKRGFLTADTLSGAIGNVSGRTFFACGPGNFYDLVWKALDDMEVPIHRRRREVYGPPKPIWGDPGWPPNVSPEATFQMTVDGAGDFSAKSSESLLASLERHGFEVPVVCRAGSCSACRIRLDAGKVFMPQDHGIREVDREQGFIHSCVAYPMSDVAVGGVKRRA